jgi:hypothetical protein
VRLSKRYTIAVDFDGVLHSYASPWVNAHTIPDPPVEGALEWLRGIVAKFDIAIYSTRNHYWRGRRAMRRWLREHLYGVVYTWAAAKGLMDHHFAHIDDQDEVELMVDDIMRCVSFPKKKPAALIYLDDRAVRFEGPGHWPTVDDIHRARPWNKRA